MKKTIVITIAMVMIVSMLFINVKAEDTHEQLYDNLNLWGQWQYLNVKGFYLFTTQGTLRHCGENDPGKCSGNPIWCGQPDGYFLNKIAGDVITKEQVMANCPSNRNKGAFLDIYYGTFIEIDMTNRASYTLTAPADIEVYCCQCYTPQEQACRITSCTNGAKEQYVCKDRQLCYSLCQNNQWVDRCEDCPSGKKCVQPQGQSASCKTSECTPGEKDCKSSSIRRTCSNSGTWVDSNCPSSQTCQAGVCTTGGGGGSNETGCAENEDAFYTNGIIQKSETSGIVFVWWGSSHNGELFSPADLEDGVAGFKDRYHNSKEDGCCSGLKPIYMDSKSYESSSTFFSIVWNHFGKTKITYDVYKCITQEEYEKQGFCVQELSNLIDKMTHTGNCQTNTIYGLVGIVLILMILMMLLRGGK